MYITLGLLIILLELAVLVLLIVAAHRGIGGFTKFQLFLNRHYACKAARKWVGFKSAPKAWSTCSHPEWMIWLLSVVWADQSPTMRNRIRTALQTCYSPDGLRQRFSGHEIEEMVAITKRRT